MEAEEDTAETPETRIKTTETQEEGKGGAAKMRDNGDGRQGWRWRRVAEIAAAEMWNTGIAAKEIREYGYGGGGYALKNSDAVDMGPYNHVKASRGGEGRGQDKG